VETDSITPQMRENLDDELTEVKSENAIDRITFAGQSADAGAGSGRARFKVRFVLDVLCEEDKALVARFVELCGCWRTMRWAAAARAGADGCASRT